MTRKTRSIFSFILASALAIALAFALTACGGQTPADEDEPHTHQWSAWEETKAASAAEEGEETRTCTGCGETQTQPIPKWPAVTFDLDGGSIEGAAAPITVSVKPGETLGEKLPPDPAKEPANQKGGWSFEGWYTGKNGTGDEFTAATPVASNQTVYAKWVRTVTLANADIPLTVADGLEIDIDEAAATIEAGYDKVSGGLKIALDANISKIKGIKVVEGGWDGYSLNTDDGITTIGADVLTETDIADMFQYDIMRWFNETCVIIYNRNGMEGNNQGSVDHKWNTTATLYPPDWVREGYVLTGWSTTPTGAVEYNNGDTYYFGSGATYITFYAVWKPI